ARSAVRSPPGPAASGTIGRRPGEGVPSVTSRGWGSADDGLGRRPAAHARPSKLAFAQLGLEPDDPRHGHRERDPRGRVVQIAADLLEQRDGAFDLLVFFDDTEDGLVLRTRTREQRLETREDRDVV